MIPRVEGMSRVELAMLVFLSATRHKSPDEFAQWCGCSFKDAVELYDAAHEVLADYAEIRRIGEAAENYADFCDY